MAVSAPSQPVRVRQAVARRPASYYAGTILRYGLLTLLSLLAFTPFILSFLGTFKSNAELTRFPPSVFPDQWSLVNWARVWNFRLPVYQGRILPLWLWNSLWLAVVNVISQLFFCSLAAYAFARIRFPGRDLIFSILIASMAIPGVITMIPGYVFFARLNWVNTFWPLIIPAIAPAFGILMLTQFLKSLPKELEEAAFLDGLGRFGTYWYVALPLSRPALITLAILQFQGSWNNFAGPLLFLQQPAKMTLTVGMNFFRTQYSNDMSAILVGAMLNAIPVLILFFIFNKYYVSGGATSGLAGQ